MRMDSTVDVDVRVHAWRSYLEATRRRNEPNERNKRKKKAYELSWGPFLLPLSPLSPWLAWWTAYWSQRLLLRLGYSGLYTGTCSHLVRTTTGWA